MNDIELWRFNGRKVTYGNAFDGSSTRSAVRRKLAVEFEIRILAASFFGEYRRLKPKSTKRLSLLKKKIIATVGSHAYVFAKKKIKIPPTYFGTRRFRFFYPSHQGREGVPNLTRANRCCSMMAKRWHVSREETARCWTTSTTSFANWSIV